MLDSLGWPEIVVLVVAALFIFGPDRLPTAAAALGRTIRRVREYATGARDQLRAEIGPEFDELRKPLDELRGIRGFDPKAHLERAFLDDRGTGDGFPGRSLPPIQGDPAPPAPRPRPLEPGERPPMDPDAT